MSDMCIYTLQAVVREPSLHSPGTPARSVAASKASHLGRHPAQHDLGGQLQHQQPHNAAATATWPQVPYCLVPTPARPRG